MIFFDVDGTLVERAPNLLAVAGRTLTAMGLHGNDAIAALLDTLQSIEASWPTWCSEAEEEAGWTEVARRCQERLAGGVPFGPLLAALRDYARWYRPIPGVPELLADLRDRGERLGVISNWPPSLERFLPAIGLGDCFEVIACSGTLGVAKPETAIFQWALRRAGVTATKATYVGNDWLNDVLPARLLGFHGILFDREDATPDAPPPRAVTVEALATLLGASGVT